MAQGKAFCVICELPAGPNDHPAAQISHMACAMEVCYKSRDEDPAEGIHAEAYKAACEKRSEQTSVK